jgi:integrase
LSDQTALKKIRLKTSNIKSNIDSSQLVKKIDSIINDQPNYIIRLYKAVANTNPANASVIYDYIIAEQTEINIKESTMADKIKKLCWLSKHLSYKSFREITKQDILDYLNSLKKPVSDDPKHKSIGTYNCRQMVFLKFFRWLYNPDEPDHRKRITPPCMIGVKALPRKEKSPYNPEDVWRQEDHTLFLKYCSVPRDRCWHSMVHDTSARPHEILDLKIKDVVFKLSGNGTQYAEVHVSGKTSSRTLPLITSIPYVKEWLEVHPFGKNPQAMLFVSIGRGNFGQPISRDGMLKHYQEHYRDDYFPKLLENRSVPSEDKEAIKKLLLKPWNLYIFRHSALTHKSQILKESTLRDHAGWTMNSKMPSVYLHYFGTESSNSLLEAYGIVKNREKEINTLKPKQCPNCNEPNKQDSRFCAKCRMVLTYDAYNETIEEKHEKDKQIEILARKQDRFEQVIQLLIDSGQLKPLA